MASSKRSRRPYFDAKDVALLCEPIYLLADNAREGGAGSGGADPVAPVLRAISASRQRDAFLSNLTAYITTKDQEIERVCKDNYSEFLTSTEKLLKVRKGTVNLKHTLFSLNNEIQETGAALADSKKQLLESNRVGNNIDETVQTLQACLRVLDLANKISRLITVDKNYYAALRSLDDLLAVHIKPLLQFPFAQHMLQSLPLTKLQIRAEVTTEFKSWLFDARESGKELGRRAIEQYEKRARRWRERGVMSSSTSHTHSQAVPGSAAASALAASNTALSKTPLNGPVEVGVSEKYEYNSSLLDDQTTQINFKPLYQCIHIYDTLDALEDLQKSYQADRKSQASLILSESQSIQPFSLDVLSQLLEEIVGFFIIESYVLSTTSTDLTLSSTSSATVRKKAPIKFRTTEQVSELWKTMSERLAHVITSGLETTSDPDIHMQVKTKLLSTVQTLQGFDYSTELLNEILAQFLRRYSSLLCSNFENDFKQIIEEDDSQPMTVLNEEELNKVLDVTYLPTEGQWASENIRSMPFPVELPFSPAYPLCCIDIRNMIAQFRKFSEGAASLQQSNEMLRDALDGLITSSIIASIGTKIQKTSNLPGLAQIVENLEFFRVACDQFASQTLATRTPLEATKYCDTTLKQAVAKIISVISRQLDGFFEDARYDWMARQPPVAGSDGEEEPSGFLLDMVNYLSLSMDNQLAGLSSSNRNEVYRGALRHCATSLMAFCTDKTTQRVSENGLAHFAVDVRFMTALASNLPEGMEEVFAELSQMVSLLESDHPAEFLDKDLRQLAYPNVTARKLLPVLSKIISHYNALDQSGRGGFDRKRKAELESVLRALQRGSQP